LEEIEKYGKLNDLTLSQSLRMAIKSIGIMYVEVKFAEKNIDILPDRYLGYIEYFKTTELKENQRGGAVLGGGKQISMGDIPVDMYLEGDLIFNVEKYDSSTEDSDVDMYICIDKKENDEGSYLLLVTIDQDGKVILKEVNEKNIKDILGGGMVIFMGDERNIS
jgi:hypothetical protein